MSRLTILTVAAKYDDDGVDIHFLNSDKSLLDCTSSIAVKQLFDSIDPEGLTPMGTKIELLLLEYMDEIERYKSKKSGKEPKKRNVRPSTHLISCWGAPHSLARANCGP